MEQKLTIAIAGTGYVGLSNAVLLAQHNRGLGGGRAAEKVELINQRKSPSEIRRSKNIWPQRSWI